MIPNDKGERYRVIEYMLDRLHEEYEELSKWEQDFVDSINEQFQMRAYLSDKQCEELEQIYDKF